MERFPYVALDIVQQCTAEHFGIQKEQLLEKKRSPELDLARRIMMFLSFRFTNLSLSKLGKAFGHKGHYNVLEARKNSMEQMKHDPFFAAAVAAIEARCRERTRALSCCIVLWSKTSGVVQAPITPEDFLAFQALASQRGIELLT